MKIHPQNLNKKVGQLEPSGSMLWHGRAWLRTSKKYDEIGCVEWMFGKLARGISAYVTFGAGEDERGIMFHVCIPFLFSIFLTLDIGWIQTSEHRLGFAVHNDAFWLYVFDGDGMRSHSEKGKRWHQRYYHWDFPW